MDTTPSRRSGRLQGGRRQSPGRGDISMTGTQLSDLMDVDIPTPVTRPPRTGANLVANSEKALYFSLDFGTKTVPVACRTYDPDAPVTLEQIRDIKFDGRGEAAPQVIGIGKYNPSTKKRDFYWGHEVQAAHDKGEVLPENTIRLYKLLLYKRFGKSSLVKRLKAQLARLQIDYVEMISLLLSRIISNAKEEIRKSPLIGRDFQEAVDTLPTKTFLSVPQMWKSPANRDMLRAAKQADIGFVDLVYEPECAAAYYTYPIASNPPMDHVFGYELIVCDVGGGTGDFVRMRYLSKAADGAKVELQTFGEATGAMCGSELVNEIFRIWFKRGTHDVNGTPMNFDQLLEFFQMTEVALLEQASERFEGLKNSFTGARRVHPLPMLGDDKDRARRCTIWLEHDDLVKFFEPVIEKIIKCVQHHYNANTKAIIITGGFGRSQYLLDKLMEAFPNVMVQSAAAETTGAHEPVARGAPLRYDKITTRGLSKNESFGITELQRYKRADHPDIDAHPDWAQPAQFSPGHVVYQRWLPILKAKDMTEPGARYAKKVKYEEARVEVQVYWTDLDLKDNAPTRNGPTAHNDLLDGIEEWGPPVTAVLPNLEREGFEKIESGGTESGYVYEVHARVALVGEGANMQAMIEVAGPDAEFDDDGQLIGETSVIGRSTTVMVEEEFNPTPRTGI